MAGPTGGRNDPFIAGYFTLEFQGMSVATFNEVVGLKMETDVFDYQEGGENSYTHRLVGVSKAPNIVCKRGFVNEPALAEWYAQVASAAGEVPRKDGSIVIYDDSAKEVGRWNFFGAWPCKWEGPAFDANKGTVACETLEFCCTRIQKQG